MTKERMTAFTDGVVAILITIMVLELKVPEGHDLHALLAQWPLFLAYALSYINVGLIWNNHHHVLMAVEHIDGRVLWGNLAVLFWLSLLPFVTAWMGESYYAPFPTALYGVVMLCIAVCWHITVSSLIRCNGGEKSFLASAIGGRMDPKTMTSALLNIVAIPSALLGYSWMAVICYLCIAALWIVPDRRIESKLISKI